MEKFRNAIWPLLLIGISIFLVNPLLIYFNNVVEFSLSYSHIITLLIITVVIFTIFIAILLTVMPITESNFRKSISFLVIIGTLIWLQSNVLLKSYGLLDGNEVDWNKYDRLFIIDALIWCIAVGISIAKADYVFNKAKSISIALIFLQLLVVGMTFYNAPQEPDWKYNRVDTSQQFDFSRNKNIIILVVDSFQSSIFQELLNENTKYSSFLQGFTYYRNSLGGFPTTYASIPLILTGKAYDNTEPIQTFVKEAYTKSSLLEKLKNKDIQVDLYPTVQSTVYLDTKTASNVTDKITFKEKITMIEKLYNLSLFRAAPTSLKKYIYQKKILDPRETYNSDVKFLDKMKENGKALHEASTFKFYHLSGVHVPYALNEEFEYEELEQNIKGYKTHAKAEMRIVKEFLDKLKELGIYDETMIVIVGDHGAGHSVDNNILKSEKIKSLADSKGSSLIGSGLPVFLVKPFNANNDFRISDVPVSLMDIPQTIAETLGIESDFSGISVFKLRENDRRIRKFKHYEWAHSDWNREYLPDMIEYEVNGFSWLPSSWNPTYKKYSAGKIEDIRPQKYQYGKEIIFGLDGNEASYISEGFSAPEPGLRWTQGNFAKLVVPMAENNIPLYIEITANALVTDNHKEQLVRVIVNGNLIETLLFDKPDLITKRVNLPAMVYENNIANILLELPNAVSPKELGANNDERRLSIAIHKLLIDKQ